MSRTRLGLPFCYKKFPQYFDAGNIHEDTDAKNAVIENLLKGYGVKTVLDLTCGTGSQVFFLADRGYDVTGADFSPALVKMAQERALREKVNCTFLDGDMRTLKVGAFDAVITIFNAVGHLTKAGFAKAMCNVHRNLHDGGIYVFDIFNLEAMTDNTVANLACHMHKKVGDTHVHAMQCSTIDRSTGILTSYDSIMLQKNADSPERMHHTFSLQLYTSLELEEMLGRSGFEVVRQCGLDGSHFVPSTTLSILTVARKTRP